LLPVWTSGLIERLRTENPKRDALIKKAGIE